MRKSIIKLLVMNLMLLILYNFVFAVESNFNKKISNMKRYNKERAQIEYTIDGNMQKGSETLIFDKWGAIEAKYSKLKIEVSGFSQETNTATFLEGTWMYNIDLNTRTGTKQENPLHVNLEGQDLQEVGKEILVKMGGKKVGTEKILGKLCEVWEIKSMGTRTWVWNWIPLKTVSNMGGMKIVITATKISDSIDAKRLKRPKDIKYNEVGNAMDIMNNLKKYI